MNAPEPPRNLIVRKGFGGVIVPRMSFAEKFAFVLGLIIGAAFTMAYFSVFWRWGL